MRRSCGRSTTRGRRLSGRRGVVRRLWLVVLAVGVLGLVPCVAQADGPFLTEFQAFMDNPDLVPTVGIRLGLRRRTTTRCLAGLEVRCSSGSMGTGVSLPIVASTSVALSVSKRILRRRSQDRTIGDSGSCSMTRWIHTTRWTSSCMRSGCTSRSPWISRILPGTS